MAYSLDVVSSNVIYVSFGYKSQPYLLWYNAVQIVGVLQN